MHKKKFFCAFFVMSIALCQAAYACTVLFNSLQKGVYSGISERTMVVVSSKGEWDRLWAEHVSMTSPMTEAPQIDFSKDMVVGVFSGDKPSGGYEVEIVKIECEEKTMTVFYREIMPSPKDIVSAVMTQPYHLIKTERQDLQIEFKEVESGESHD